MSAPITGAQRRSPAPPPVAGYSERATRNPV